MILYEELSKYRDLTISMIDRVKSGNSFEKIIDERQDIVDNLQKINFTKNEIKKCVEELNIGELDKQLTDLIIEARKRIHVELVNVKKAKVAQNQYNNLKRYTMGFDVRK